MKSYYLPGTSGAGGGGGGSTVTEETPSGTINGVNNTFTITSSPTTLLLFRNGILQEETVDYTLSGTTITFLNLPQTGDWLGAVLIA